MQVSKLAMSEGPKLTHLTASRPKVKGRRPPKRYDVFHEDDSKEVREGGREGGREEGRGGEGGQEGGGGEEGRESALY